MEELKVLRIYEDKNNGKIFETKTKKEGILNGLKI